MARSELAGKSATWHIKPTVPKKEGGVQVSEDGTPTYISLTRWSYDRSLRGRLWSQCCDCGLEHLLSFEVFQDAVGAYWLVKRPYRVGTVKRRKPHARHRKGKADRRKANRKGRRAQQGRRDGQARRHRS